jgi:hypothetical protein
MVNMTVLGAEVRDASSFQIRKMDLEWLAKLHPEAYLKQNLDLERQRPLRVDYSVHCIDGDSKDAVERLSDIEAPVGNLEIITRDKLSQHGYTSANHAHIYDVDTIPFVLHAVVRYFREPGDTNLRLVREDVLFVAQEMEFHGLLVVATQCIPPIGKHKGGYEFVHVSHSVRENMLKMLDMEKTDFLDQYQRLRDSVRR